MHDMRKSRFESLDFARLEANTVSVFEKKTDVAELPEEKQMFPGRSDGKTGKQENPPLQSIYVLSMNMALS